MERQESAEFRALLDRAMEIRRGYAALEKQRYGRAWTREEVLQGFVGDVGDLAKLAMARAGIRRIPDAREKLAHELADCLWSILVLSELYGVDLEEAFGRTMDELEQTIAATLEAEEDRELDAQ
jgi:NTP pyrophosphatase (non-canonical NTP hydrolase)